MYIGALIQLPGGAKKIVEANGKLALFTFTAKIGEYARKENKLVKVLSDDFKVRKILRNQLDGVPIEYGLKGELELELKANETQKV
jgi:hypothetical protein